MQLVYCQRLSQKLSLSDSLQEGQVEEDLKVLWVYYQPAPRSKPALVHSSILLTHTQVKQRQLQTMHCL